MIHPDLPQKALSIRQPWAWLILNGGKDIENRDWETRFRGEFCIHASKTMTKDEWHSGFYTCRDIKADLPFPMGVTFPAHGEFALGGIVGVASISACVLKSESPWFFGRAGFVLENVRAVDFIPVKGALGFFDWRKNVIEVPA